MKISKNVHPLERVVRVSIGLGLLTQVFWGVKNPWFVLGVIPLLTGLFGFCPPYAWFGLNTCELGKKKPN